MFTDVVGFVFAVVVVVLVTDVIGIGCAVVVAGLLIVDVVGVVCAVVVLVVDDVGFSCAVVVIVLVIALGVDVGIRLTQVLASDTGMYS